MSTLGTQQFVCVLARSFRPDDEALEIFVGISWLHSESH